MGLEEDQLKEKLLKWEQNKPAFKQVKLLSDLADMMQESISVLDAIEKGGQSNAKQFGALLTDIREKLSSLDSKEAPETPDYAKPVLDGFKQLEKALAASIKGIDVKPVVNIPKLDTPVVNVTPPSVDLKGVEKILKTELPKAFKEAIAQIPEDTDIDYTDKFNEMLEWLKSIDTASRMKPSGNTKIINVSELATAIGTSTSTPNYATKIDTTTTSGVTYIGKAAIASSAASAVWQIKKLDSNTLALDKTWADGNDSFDNVWNNRASLTYS